MIKMTNELFNKLSDKQYVLDSMIKEKFNITDNGWKEDLQVNHELAIKGEVAEFINEARDLWKYWKQKAVDKEALIDEAVDVIHFIHLVLNKNDYPLNDYYVTFINTRAKTLRSLNTAGRELLNDMYRELKTIEDYLQLYSLLIVVLERYDFTLEDIEAAYDKKNEENHSRQKQEY